jgi:exosortase F-associated protein
LSLKRILALVIGCIGLLTVYLLQHYLDFYSMLIEFKVPQKLDYGMQQYTGPKLPFIFNKTMRYFVNDIFAICIIYALFQERKYTRFAFYVMIFGVLVLHPTYLYLIFEQPKGFSSAISHLHRIIMNPVLMMILIPAFYFQKKQSDTYTE